MYQSVFKDMCGSDLIFASPLKSFTYGNNSSNANNHVIFGIHSAIRNTEEEDDWAEERQ